MNNTYIIGALAAIIIIGGGLWLISGAMPGSGTATTTPQTATGNNDNTPVADATPGVPTVTTDTLVVASNSGAVLTGKVIPNGLQTTYWYEYGPTSALGMTSLPQSIGSGYVSISAPAFVSGLHAQSAYSFRLVAQNSLGKVAGMTYSFSTNTTPPPAGSTPAVRTDAATNITRTSADIGGQVTPDMAQTSYWFEYGTTNALGFTTPFADAGNGNFSSSRVASIGGLSPMTTYYFRIDAQNQFGTVNGVTRSFTTAGPAASTAPTAKTNAASAITSTGATLNGSVNPNGLATTYWFEYSSGAPILSVGHTPVLGAITGTTQHQSVVPGMSAVSVFAPIKGLSTHTTYSYHLVTENSVGTTVGDPISFQTSRSGQ